MKGDTHVKHKFDLYHPTAHRHEPYVLHIPARVLYVGPYPPQSLSLLGSATTLSQSFLLAQAISEPKPFSYKYSQHFRI